MDNNQTENKGGSVNAPKSILIVGASEGMGEAIARILRQKGWIVFVAARSLDKLQKLASETGAVAIQADATKDQDVAAMYEQTRAHLNGQLPDVVFYNPGLFDLLDVWDIDMELLENYWQVNVAGAIRVSLPFVRELHERGAGQLVLMGSLAGLEFYNGDALYSLTKFGLRGFLGPARKDFEVARQYRVFLNCIEPGAVDTPLWDKIFADPQKVAKYQLPPREDMLKPEEVAEQIVDVLEHPDTYPLDIPIRRPGDKGAE